MEARALTDIGKRIRGLRIMRNVSQGDFARWMGFSQTNLSNIEHGKTAPTLKNLFKMRELLGCSMTDFFEDNAGHRGGGVLKRPAAPGTQPGKNGRKKKTAQAEAEIKESCGK